MSRPRRSGGGQGSAGRALGPRAGVRIALAGLLVAASAGLMSGCGGAGASLDEPQAVEQTAGPGRLLASTALLRFGIPAVREALAALGERVPALEPRWEVETHRLEYLSTDVDGREIRVSGLLAVPLKPAGARSPVLSYQHATIFRDEEAPSLAVVADAPPVVMASLGYIVLAADYVGYGVSKGTPHPYLLSVPSASAVVDLLTAGRTWRLQRRLASNGQLFMAGYSEGGYVTMAAHRALQSGAAAPAAELVAVAPGAGPFDLGVTLDVLLRRVKDQNAFLGALIDPGFLSKLPSSLRDEVRRALVRELIPDDADVAFDTKFIDAFLADDRALIERQSNVHDWAPAVPVHLFHGRDDQTVPYAASESAHAAMRARGAGAVSFDTCTATPAGHKDCVPQFWQLMVQRLGALARDL